MTPQKKWLVIRECVHNVAVLAVMDKDGCVCSDSKDGCVYSVAVLYIWQVRMGYSLDCSLPQACDYV